MVNIDGELKSSNYATIAFNNRGTFYGDGIFETIRCFNGKPLLYEAHYFRLMSGMRILRMDIPASFTPEFIEDSIIDILNQNNFNTGHARVRFTVWRKSGGLYTPLDNGIHYSIQSTELDGIYQNNTNRIAELFKDHYVLSGLLNTIKSTNKIVNVLAGRYALDNDYQEMFLVNEKKMITEGISGNVFVRTGNKVKTPPVLDGCLNGLMREQVIQQLKRMLDYDIIEETLSPFELQRADEIFTTNVIKGIQSVNKYRKKEFNKELATELLEIFNDKFFD
ncbi:aminotransferase class IV [Nonlabens ulvanivorans]|uniref:aminotransferase class IV n=1 Tax=Nonlabens ulvanivorans TaxID=906888 RepID=UPI0037C70F3C